MFSLSENNKFQMYSRLGVDMRKGVNPLCGIVRFLFQDPTDGSVYVFMNRSRTLMKLLHWERGGYVIYYKRMELGRLSRKVFSDVSLPCFRKFRWDELLLIMEGVPPSDKRRKLTVIGWNRHE